MPTDSPHLSQINTRWSLLAQAAQRADAAAAQLAQAEFLPRYYPAVHRYLLAAVGDPAAADDLCQEFALRFVRGDFRRARPGQGRFRDQLTAALAELIAQHLKRPTGKRLDELSKDPTADPDRAFAEQWRQDVLNQAWAALAAEGGDPPTAYEVLRRRVAAADRRSADVAADLTVEYGRPFTADGVRQLIHRARERFAVGLRRVVGESIGTADPAAVDAELAELGLLAYCG